MSEALNNALMKFTPEYISLKRRLAEVDTLQAMEFYLEKVRFLFHVKSSFRAGDSYIIVLTFWLCLKKA